MGTKLGNAEWTAREIKLLGTRPDAELACLIGRTAEGVSLNRQKLGIEAPMQPGWNDDESKLLGRLPDKEVALRVKRSLSAVQSKRLLLGINRQRKARRDPVDPNKVKLLFGPYRDWTPQEDRFLGTASDAKVGRMLGRTMVLVQLRWWGLGLLPHREKQLRRKKVR